MDQVHVPQGQAMIPAVTSIEAVRIERLVIEHLPVARRLAGRYAGRGEPLDDLVQVANLGLLIAVRRYDESRGIPFVGYAIPMIVGELKRHFRDHCWPMHLERSAQERAVKVHRRVRESLERTGVTPPASQLAPELELTERDVMEALEAYRVFSLASLDAPIGSHPDPESLGQVIGSSDRAYDAVDTRLTLAAALRTLTLIERRIFCLRYLGELTQCQVAARVGVSQMQVSRVLRRIQHKLEHVIREPGTNRPHAPDTAAPAIPAAWAA